MVLKLLLPIGTILLASCQSVSGSFCDLAKPIRMTPAQVDQLTDEQVREFLGHNERLRKLCGVRP